MTLQGYCFSIMVARSYKVSFSCSPTDFFKGPFCTQTTTGPRRHLFGSPAPSKAPATRQVLHKRSGWIGEPLKGYSALHWPCKLSPTPGSSKRRQGRKEHLNLPLDLALDAPFPLTLWAQVKAARYSWPGTKRELRKYWLAEWIQYRSEIYWD